VRFNPERPGESVLEPRVPAGWILVALIAVALLVLAAHIYENEA
jgi:preprotein translocase subunit Sec61beta